MTDAPALLPLEIEVGRVLAVVAHPDDLEYGMAGAIAKWTSAGRQVAYVLVTRGEHGMSLFERGQPPRHVAAAAREVFDVTGAGDSVIATLALALAAGGSLAESAALANAAASVVVGKLGTAQATPPEVLQVLRGASRRRARPAF